jgi:hypothetical protein
MVATPEAVRASLRILSTHRALFQSGRSCGWGISMNEDDIARVIRVFNSQGAAWALVGAHAVGLLTEPRATADFDFIVDDRKIKGITRALAAEFGELGEQDLGAAIRLSAIDVDLIRSTNHPLFREALEQVRLVGDWKVPRAEVIMALKFLSAVSPWRNQDRRAQDLVDLRRIYHAVGPEELDRDYMVKLSGLAYPGAEREFEGLLRRIDRGEPIGL